MGKLRPVERMSGEAGMTRQEITVPTRTWRWEESQHSTTGRHLHERGGAQREEAGIGQIMKGFSGHAKVFDFILVAMGSY
jgi:hypothetical protein